MFVRQSWYVFGWVTDFDDADLRGKVIIGEPVVVWRSEEGKLLATEDRCPHRHAPLSRGRVIGSKLQCMYHGLTIGSDGRCLSMPLMENPPKVGVKMYPVVEKDSWIWIWMGDPANADEALIPDAFGLDDPSKPMRWNSIEYDAHYQLIHDNLCDLSHVDFVHSTTLQVASGASWSATEPRITRPNKNTIRIERWFVNADLPGNADTKVDTWITYDFILPGIFLLKGARYPAGTAASFEGKAPSGIEPISRNIEQQAVTPISDTKTAYHYATGLIGSSPEMTARLAQRMDVVMAAFEEDRQMIEAQQRIRDLTPDDVAMTFLPQDKGPHLMRQMIKKCLENERVDA